MKRIFFALSLCGALALARCALALDADIARFADAKEAQVRDLAAGLTNKVPSAVWSFFDAVRVDDYQTATNLSARIDRASGRYTNSDLNAMSPALRTLIWPPISETIGAYDEFHDLGEKWSRRFAREVIDSIPKGSIYFGGTDAGRFIISAFSESQREGRPFFTLTQNQLADGTYLEYLRNMYGRKINMLSANDSQKAFNDYYEDLQARYKVGKLKPGENAELNEDGKLQISGLTAVMTINGLMVKMIIEKNPDREFYLEQSYAIDWMYPNLSPHGLILKLSAQPLDSLREEEVQKDQAYWKRFTGELIGDWITDKTSTKEICDFIDRVYRKKDRSEFKGSVDFLQTEEAQEEFSKLCLAHAELYAWRAVQAKEADEKTRMQNAAELAFRRSFCLCPHVPTPLRDFVRFLLPLGRQEEALALAQTSLLLNPDDSPARNEILNLIHTIRKAQ